MEYITHLDEFRAITAGDAVILFASSDIPSGDLAKDLFHLGGKFWAIDVGTDEGADLAQAAGISDFPVACRFEDGSVIAQSTPEDIGETGDALFA